MVETAHPVRVSNRDVYSTVLAESDLTDVDGRPVGVVVGGGKIVDARVYAGTAPTTDSADFDINVNGTSIFGATKVVIAATENEGTIPAFTTTDVVDGDVITVDVDALDTGDTADKVLVQVTVE